MRSAELRASAGPLCLALSETEKEKVNTATAMLYLSNHTAVKLKYFSSSTVRSNHISFALLSTLEMLSSGDFREQTKLDPIEARW
jgi:hypothetical protein